MVFSFDQKISLPSGVSRRCPHNEVDPALYRNEPVARAQGTHHEYQALRNRARITAAI